MPARTRTNTGGAQAARHQLPAGLVEQPRRSIGIWCVLDRLCGIAWGGSRQRPERGDSASEKLPREERILVDSHCRHLSQRDVAQEASPLVHDEHELIPGQRGPPRRELTR